MLSTTPRYFYRWSESGVSHLFQFYCLHNYVRYRERIIWMLWRSLWLQQCLLLPQAGKQSSWSQVEGGHRGHLWPTHFWLHKPHLMLVCTLLKPYFFLRLLLQPFPCFPFFDPFHQRCNTSHRLSTFWYQLWSFWKRFKSRSWQYYFRISNLKQWSCR